MTLQAFKANDLVEAKVKNCFLPLLDALGVERDDFYDGAYECFSLGDVLFVLNRSPFARTLTAAVFRETFFAIHSLFTRPGTFEFYMQVFRAVWGPDVVVEFTTPAPGKLLINISEIGVENADLLAREIVDDVYVFHEIMTEDGFNLAARVAKGIKTQAETDALLFELYPAGLWVQATLTL